MRVLIIEDHPGDTAAAGHRLQDAGHQILSCMDPTTGGRCRAILPGRACPLDDGPVDAALMAIGPGDHATPPGLFCAARRHLPALSLLHAGDDPAGVVAAIEQVATIAPPGHAEAARLAIRASLDRAGHAAVGIEVTVERDAGRLQIRLTTDQPLPPAVTHAAAVRALGAVRRVDPTAPTIGVTVEP